MSSNISELRHSGYPEKQAIAIAYSEKRKSTGHKAKHEALKKSFNK